MHRGRNSKSRCRERLAQDTVLPARDHHGLLSWERLTREAKPISDSDPANSMGLSADDSNTHEPAASGDSAGNESPIERIIAELMESGELFHTPEGEPFLSFPVNGHWDTVRIGDSPFREWVAMTYYNRTEKLAPESIITQITSALAGKAKFSSPTCQVFVRVGDYAGCIYLDLANERREVVVISSDGWDVVPNSPVKFRRSRGMLPLPHPTRGGSVDQLRPLLNLSDDQWVLTASWLVGALRVSGPYPILVLEGSHGSAKSTASRLLRQLIDPSTASARFAPRDAADLMIGSRNRWCQVFDNLSGVSGWLSDAVCRLATGGGFSTRTLYSNDDETIFDATRPVLLNGIDVNISRGDLLDRSIILSLPAIADSSRCTEAELCIRFESVRAAVLGALCTAVSCALRRMPEVTLPSLPRMADFAKWVTAAEPALGWPDGTMLSAYNRNRRSAGQLALEASPIVPLAEILVAQGTWTGTAAELMYKLSECFPDYSTRPRDWPRSPRDLSASLRRLVPNLRDAGIDVQFGQTSGSQSRRTITISRLREA